MGENILSKKRYAEIKYDKPTINTAILLPLSSRVIRQVIINESVPSMAGNSFITNIESPSNDVINQVNKGMRGGIEKYPVSGYLLSEINNNSSQ